MFCCTVLNCTLVLLYCPDQYTISAVLCWPIHLFCCTVLISTLFLLYCPGQYTCSAVLAWTVYTHVLLYCPEISKFLISNNRLNYNIFRESKNWIVLKWTHLFTEMMTFSILQLSPMFIKSHCLMILCLLQMMYNGKQLFTTLFRNTD